MDSMYNLRIKKLIGVQGQHKFLCTSNRFFLDILIGDETINEKDLKDEDFCIITIQSFYNKEEIHNFINKMKTSDIYFREDENNRIYVRWDDVVYYVFHSLGTRLTIQWLNTIFTDWFNKDFEVEYE